MHFTTIIASILACTASQTLAAPAPISSHGFIAQKSGVENGYAITGLSTCNTTVTNGQRYNNVTFTVTAPSNASDNARCTYKWPINGTYYVETYTPCSNPEYQFLIQSGSFTNLSQFTLEVEHSSPSTVQDGFEIPGTSSFALANVTKQSLGCMDMAGGMACRQGAAIEAVTKYMVGK
ncbi:hypothetical protein MBLNU457_g0153t1 [Dothideomycetes sp. NU457]